MSKEVVSDQMQSSRERTDLSVLEELSLLPYLILSDTVLGLSGASSLVDFSDSRVCLSPPRRRWPRPLCDRPYASRLLQDLLCRLVRVSGSLSSLRGAAIADRSPASRPVLFCKSPGPLLHTLLRSVLSRAHDGDGHHMPSLCSTAQYTLAQCP